MGTVILTSPRLLGGGGGLNEILCEHLGASQAVLGVKNSPATAGDASNEVLPSSRG